MTVVDSIEQRARVGILALIATPAVIIFISSNFVNVGNLAFNVIFSRLMGPELFGVLALLLTIKLAFLGVLGSVQMAVSQMIAGSLPEEPSATEHALSGMNQMLPVKPFIIVSLLLSALALIYANFAQLELKTPHLLLLMSLALPFGASLSVLRGVAFGKMQTTRIVLSANIEMFVRLIGAVLAWSLGFGIEGVVTAICVSILAGWAVLSDLLPKSAKASGQTNTIVKTLFLSSLPFAALQMAQVLALDGDIFLATLLLPASESGLIAALSLFQRIQFFACFALASIMLPSVISAVRNHTSLRPALLPVAALFLAVSLPLLGLVAAAPERLIIALVGDAYLEASAGLWLAAVSAVSFTLSFLIATFLIALGNRIGVILVLIAAAVQLGLMATCQPELFADLLKVKASVQISTTIILISYVVINKRHADRRALSFQKPSKD